MKREVDGVVEAVCTRFKEMKWDDKVLKEPFPCDPTKQEKKCQLYFEVGDNDGG